MARIRVFVLAFAITVSMLAAVIETAPVHASPIPSQAPGSVRIFLPLVTQFNQENTPAPLPSLTEFIHSIANPSLQGISGIYVPSHFAYRVVAQPAGNYAFVSSAADTVTEFGLAGDGVVGLLGHESLAGKGFPTLQPNQEIYLIWPDGRTRKFIIASAHHYQALAPSSPSSDFIDLDTGVQISASDLFVEYYMGGEHVTLQTCIAKDGNPNWGRLFVVAIPAN